jgi:ABC-type polysaccharide/polyol phosphate export permease
MNTLIKKTNDLFDDLKKGAFSWRIWYTLAISDIRMRHSRSKIGQFWITISTGIFIGAIGTVNDETSLCPSTCVILHVAVIPLSEFSSSATASATID